MPKILEFELNGSYYAMEIHLTREIVESLPITPIPRTPGYIAGMTNIRGEITTLIAIDELIGIREHERSPSRKFIIFMPEAARGNNIGMIVDEVYSVLEVDESDIEFTGNGGGTAKRSFVKGIIRIHDASNDVAGTEVSQRLVLYLDIDNLISYLFEMASR